MSERMNKERATEILTDLYNHELIIFQNNADEPSESDYTNIDVKQALHIAIECVEEKIKREKNSHRGKREAYWTYTGNGDDLGRWLEIQCNWCNKKFQIASPDENYKFSYETAQKDLDKYCPTECPNCKRKMIGWRKYYFAYQEPTPIRYYERKE